MEILTREATREGFEGAKSIAAFIDEIHIHLRWIDSWRFRGVGDPVDHRAHISAIYATEAARRLGIEVPSPPLVPMTKAGEETRWFEALEANAVRAVGPDFPGSVLTIHQPEWELTILEAIQTSKKPLKNHADVAKAAGYQHNSNLKSHMADLKRRKIIEKRGGRYFVKSQGLGQD
jgi:hypothetical protein